VAGRPLSAIEDLLPLLRQLKCVGGQQIQAELLPGGLTNVNVRVRTHEQDVVVRISPPAAGLLTIDRDVEFQNSSRAAAAGVAPEVIEYLPGKGVLAVEFVPSRTLDEVDVSRDLARIAATLRTLHTTASSFVNEFDMFATQERYLALLTERGWPVPSGYAALAPAWERLRTALRSSPEARVPCHNDLLAANFLDDGDRLWIIDFEYSGNNEPAFELGNLAQENHLDDAQLATLATHYYGADDERLVARCRLWQIASAYAWTLWGLISARTNPLDFDFEGWGLEKFERARSEIADPGFEVLLRLGSAIRDD